MGFHGDLLPDQQFPAQQYRAAPVLGEEPVIISAAVAQPLWAWAHHTRKMVPITTPSMMPPAWLHEFQSSSVCVYFIFISYGAS